jgi:imidazoleglycerol-phosphate dehydratase
VFFEAFARSAQANLHVRLVEGSNLHHIVEISFKALARALRQATELDPRTAGVPSTKGSLD